LNLHYRDTEKSKKQVLAAKPERFCSYATVFSVFVR